MERGKKIRYIIITALIAVFVIVGAGLIYYAKGYRLNMDKKKIESVSIIMVSKDPADAIVTVDGNQAPYDITAFGYERFTNIPPGNHFIKIEREGYIPWQKNLRTDSKIVTWARYATLFKKEPAQKEILSSEKEIKAIETSPEKEKVALILSDAAEKSFLKIINLKTEEQSEFLIPARIEKAEVIWSKNSNSILINIKSPEINSYLTSSENSTIVDIENKTGKEISDSAFSPENQNKLLLLSNKTLYHATTEEILDQQKIIAQNVASFHADKKTVYFMQETPKDFQNSEFKTVDLDGKNEKTLSYHIEKDASYEIKISKLGKRSILCKNGSLYVVSDISTERLAENIRQADWGDDNDKEEETGELLLYASQHEIYIYEPSIENSELITRYSEEISALDWYPGNFKYVYFAVSGKLKSIEIDERDVRNTADIYLTDKEIASINPLGEKFKYILIELKDKDSSKIIRLETR